PLLWRRLHRADCKRLLPHYLARRDVVGRLVVSRVDLRPRHKPLDLDCPCILDSRTRRQSTIYAPSVPLLISSRLDRCTSGRAAVTAAPPRRRLRGSHACSSSSSSTTTN